MDPRPSDDVAPVSPAELADEAVALARRWVDVAAATAPEPGARRLAGLLRDPDGFAFAVGFVDGVVRPDDDRAAGRAFERLARRLPRALPWWERSEIVVGGGFATTLPRPVVPLARRAFRRMVGHLVLDAAPARLDKRLAELRAAGVEVDLAVLGEAVLGEEAAADRLERVRELIARPDVSAVSLAIADVVAPRGPWAVDDLVEAAVERLAPVYELAADLATRLTLQVHEHRDLAVAIEVLDRVLDRPGLAGVDAGITLPASLPESIAAVGLLRERSARRVAEGGTSIRIRLVKGANVPLERVEAELRGWPLATWDGRVETDAAFIRCLDLALAAEPDAEAPALRLGVASHNLFDLALATLLARRRGLADATGIEMLLGMSDPQRAAVAADAGPVLVSAPIVRPDEFDASVPYLVRRLEESADEEHFLSRASAFAGDPEAFAVEEARFREALALAADAGDEIPASPRAQDRSAGIELPSGRFENVPDTDPASPGNRRWAVGVLERVPGSTRGEAALAAAAVPTADGMRRVVDEAAEAGAAWGARPAGERAAVLLDAADVLEAFRGRLIEAAAAEAGTPLPDGDVEVSAVVDSARWSADRALQLEQIVEARFVADRVAVVIPSAREPIASAGRRVLAVLAAGAAAILVPAAGRSAAVLCEALHEAGVPREALRLVAVPAGDGQTEDGPADAPGDDALAALLADPRVDRVLLDGPREAAARLRSARPDLPLLADTGAGGSLVVTGAADLDQAVLDLVRSAFGPGGRGAAAARLAILIGSPARGARFRRALADAVRALHVGPTDDPRTVLGPLPEPAAGDALLALTELGPGESWLVEPRRLDEEGRLWSPGVRDGVRPGARRPSAGAPVLDLMAVSDLDEAIAVQNDGSGGTAAGIHSLDPLEVADWVDRVEAGGLFVNRPITGAVVRRQPIGGWGASAVGPGARLGGPNALVPLGSWQDMDRDPLPHILVEGISRDPAGVLKRAQVALDFPGFDFVRRAALDDERWWTAEFGIARDRGDLEAERDVIRYRPAAVTVRLAEGAPMEHLTRLLCAAALTRSVVTISSALPLPAPLTEAFASPVPPMRVAAAIVEGDDAFLERLARGPAPARIRLAGGDAAAVHEALGGSIDTAVWSGPVTASGRVELLPFLREQSVSVTAHRFGAPFPAMLRLPL